MTSPYTKDYFNSRFQYDADRVGVWKIICRYLEKYISKDAAVLDLGAGYCSFINEVSAKQKYALDLYQAFSEHAKEGVSCFVQSCEDLSFLENASLDVVFASNLLEHLTWPSLETMLKEVTRVLKPSGRLILIQPNFRYAYKEYFDDFTHIQIFTDVSLRDWLCSRGFEIEHYQPRFLPLSMKSRLPKWPWLVKLYLALPFRPMAKQMLVVAKKRGFDVES